MTTGEKIRQTLKLDYDNIFITKGILSGGRPVYFIFFNSKFPNASIQYNKVMSHQKFDFYRGDKLEQGVKQRMTYFPFEQLDKFDRSITNAYFIVYDLADYMRTPRYDWYTECVNAYDDIISNDTRLVEKCVIGKGRLEEITLEQLRKVDKYTSDKAQFYKDERQKFQGQGIKNTKFLNISFIKNTGSVQFYFLTESTDFEDKNKADHKVKTDKKQQYDLTSDKLIDNPSHTYDMILQVDNVFPNDSTKDISWLEVFSGEPVNSKLLKQILEVANIQIWDNTPAYQMQGYRFRLSQLDGGSSIYPESRPDTFWRQKHGNYGYLDKHFSQLLSKSTLDVFLNNMTSSFFSLLKKEGYIDPKTNVVKV